MLDLEREINSAKEKPDYSTERVNLMEELGEDPYGFGLVLSGEKKILIYWHIETKEWLERDFQEEGSNLRWGDPRREVSNWAAHAVLEFLGSKEEELFKSPTQMINDRFISLAYKLKKETSSIPNAKGKAREALKEMKRLGHRDLQRINLEEETDPIGRFWAKSGARDLEYSPTPLTRK
ncbi:MAG: hypothetical protein P8Y06_02370 [Patescibacteria group bacterium]